MSKSLKKREQTTAVSEAPAVKVDESRFSPEARRWRAENAEAIKAWNAWVEEHGLPLEEYRMF